MDYVKGDYFIVPNRSSLRTLPGNVQSVYINICSRADNSGWCYPSYDTIAEDAGVARSTAVEAIKKLEEVGLIEKSHRTKEDGSLSSNGYQLVLGGVVRQADGGSPPGNLGVVRQATSNDNHSNDKQLTTSETDVSRNDTSIEDDVSFEDDEEIVPTKTLRKKGVPKSIEPEIQKMWALWPGDHGQWKINKTIRSASEILLREKGMEKIANAVKYWLDNKTQPFCPDISTPYKLGEKWDSLVAYRRNKRYGR